MMAMGSAARQKLPIHAVVLISGAEQPVRGKGAGKGEHVRDEHQRVKDEARGQDGQGARPKDRRLSVKQGGGDQIAEKHDGVDHGDERVDLGASELQEAPKE